MFEAAGIRADVFGIEPAFFWGYYEVEFLAVDCVFDLIDGRLADIQRNDEFSKIFKRFLDVFAGRQKTPGRSGL